MRAQPSRVGNSSRRSVGECPTLQRANRHQSLTLPNCAPPPTLPQVGGAVQLVA